MQALTECEFRISAYNQESEDFENILEKLTTYSISTDCFKTVVAGLWPVRLFTVVRGQKYSRTNSRLAIFRSVPSFLLL